MNGQECIGIVKYNQCSPKSISKYSLHELFPQSPGNCTASHTMPLVVLVPLQKNLKKCRKCHITETITNSHAKYYLLLFFFEGTFRAISRVNWSNKLASLLAFLHMHYEMDSISKPLSGCKEYDRKDSSIVLRSFEATRSNRIQQT